MTDHGENCRCNLCAFARESAGPIALNLEQTGDLQGTLLSDDGERVAQISPRFYQMEVATEFSRDLMDSAIQQAKENPGWAIPPRPEMRQVPALEQTRNYTRDLPTEPGLYALLPMRVVIRVSSASRSDGHHFLMVTDPPEHRPDWILPEDYAGQFWIALPEPPEGAQ